jgi:hypothetical protein
MAQGKPHFRARSVLNCAGSNFSLGKSLQRWAAMIDWHRFTAEE